MAENNEKKIGGHRAKTIDVLKWIKAEEFENPTAVSNRPCELPETCDGILVGTTNELCYVDKATGIWSSLITKRRFQQIDVQERQNILVTLSGKKQRIRVYNLAWLRSIYLKPGTVTKKVAWNDVGYLTECSGFKIVNYEKLKLLAISMHNRIELYAWASKPYHKFMAFKSFQGLKHNPEVMNIFVPGGRKCRLVFGSRHGFQAIDTDTANTYDIPLSTRIKDIANNFKTFAITAVPDSNHTEIILCLKNVFSIYDGAIVFVDINGAPFINRKVTLQKDLYAVAESECGLLIGLGNEVWENLDAKTGIAQRSQIDKRLTENCILLFTHFDTRTSQLEIWFSSKRQLHTISFPVECQKADHTVIAAEIKKLGFETADDFEEMTRKGSYRCYWNRLYFVGPYNVGKTTLAKLLVADPMPVERKSTDGIWLYIGRAGMDIEKRKWVFLPKEQFMCSKIECYFTSCNVDAILEHSVSNHSETEQFKVRQQILDDKSGRIAYKSVYFNISIGDIIKHKNLGQKCNIDIDRKTIRFKRAATEAQENIMRDVCDQATQTDTDGVIYAMIPDVVLKLKQMNRLDDFVSVMNCIQNDIITNNIAFQLLLDVGRFYAQSTITNMRYEKETIVFWATVQKLFKGKGINFFRGYKGEGKNGFIRPCECYINFAVPSDPILAKETVECLRDAGKTGILHRSLEAFAEQNKGKDIKLAIDGKKIAFGFGKMGDEDLDGDEKEPVLADRQHQIKAEIENLEKMKSLLEVQSIDGIKELKQMDRQNLETLKTTFLKSISDMSCRIKELRELTVKRKLHLENLLKVVDGDWKTSKVANAISFWQTKLIHSQTTIKNLLECIDGLGFTVACINGTGENYITGSKVTINFDNQSNYICLRDTNNLLLDDSKSDAHITKQHSEQWHSIRKDSRVTGSSIFRAIGLGTLKEQQTHFDNKINGIEENVSKELQTLFDYGTEQEVNALATLLGKIIPVYFPWLTYVEDGCEKIQMGTSCAVVSGDGSGINEKGVNEMAFEFKCPRTGKTRTTDVHYRLPIYYTTQVLSQMAVKNCNSASYLSYTPESVTFLKGSMNHELWSEIWRECEDQYGSPEPMRPSRKRDSSKDLLQRLEEFSKQFTFISEFPSLQGIPCSCESAKTKNNVFHRHSNFPDGTASTYDELSLDAIASFMERSMTALQEAYNILRRPAKEVLVTVASDLDRLENGEAVPVQYGLSGFSLHMKSVRSMLNKTVKLCLDKQVYVKAIAFDGQFLEIALEDNCGKPLTILKFMKKYWSYVTKLDKNEKLSDILGNVKSKASIIPSPKNITKALERRKQGKQSKAATESENETSDFDILQFLPDDIVSKMDDEAIAIIKRAGSTVAEKAISINEVANDASCIEFVPTNEDYEVALITLIAHDMETDKEKWQLYTFDSFKDCFRNANIINTHFTVTELKLLLNLHPETKSFSHNLKPQCVNLISKLYGNGSSIQEPQKTPKTLQMLCKNHIKTWNADAINVAYAQKHFIDAFKEWDDKNVFNGQWCILYEGQTEEINIHQWYAQPASIENQLVQPIIDPHHLLVNNRARCCSVGMEGMGVKPDAWWEVAQHSRENETGLSLEIAKELRDRQSNAFAQTTFSERVQATLQENGYTTEAYWCKLIRNWYHAIDDAGVDIKTRVRWLLEMRTHLLLYLKIGHFPPPGAYINGMPIAQFEGILSNVDRRLQLYAMVQTKCYNQRAITSLDSETFFSAFQDYDPKGTGVLRPDDIPLVLGAAQYIYSQRLNKNRTFIMKTSRKTRVYPERPLQSSDTSAENIEMENDFDIFESKKIVIRHHIYDSKERVTKKPKRKIGRITPFGKPSKGAEGARSYHKTNEEQLLPHRRYGLMDDELF